MQRGMYSRVSTGTLERVFLLGLEPRQCIVAPFGVRIGSDSMSRVSCPILSCAVLL